MMQWICGLMGHQWGWWRWSSAIKTTEERYCLRCNKRQSIVYVDDSEWTGSDPFMGSGGGLP